MSTLNLFEAIKNQFYQDEPYCLDLYSSIFSKRDFQIKKDVDLSEITEKNLSDLEQKIIDPYIKLSKKIIENPDRLILSRKEIDLIIRFYTLAMTDLETLYLNNKINEVNAIIESVINHDLEKLTSFEEGKKVLSINQKMENGTILVFKSSSELYLTDTFNFELIEKNQFSNEALQNVPSFNDMVTISNGYSYMSRGFFFPINAHVGILVLSLLGNLFTSILNLDNNFKAKNCLDDKINAGYRNVFNQMRVEFSDRDDEQLSIQYSPREYLSIPIFSLSISESFYLNFSLVNQANHYLYFEDEGKFKSFANDYGLYSFEDSLPLYDLSSIEEEK